MFKNDNEKHPNGADHVVELCLCLTSNIEHRHDFEQVNVCWVHLFPPWIDQFFLNSSVLCFYFLLNLLHVSVF